MATMAAWRTDIGAVEVAEQVQERDERQKPQI